MQFAALTLLPILALLAGAAPLATPRLPKVPKTGIANIGEGTYYQPGLGACGAYNVPTDMIAAVAIGRGKGECGKRVRVRRGKKYVDVVIQDLCGACKPGDIDMTEEAFKKLGTLGEGRVPVKWSYL